MAKIKKQHRVPMSILVLVAISGLIGVNLYGVTNDCDGSNLKGRDVNKFWREGELILIFRHTARCEEDAFSCPPGEDALTVEGVNQAQLVHMGLQHLGSGEIDSFHSPMIRTTMTAGIVLPEQSSPATWLVNECKIGLFEKLRSHKRPSVNLVLFTHSSCLNSLKNKYQNPLLDFNAGDDKYFGVGVLFLPDDAANWDVSGCILPAQWHEFEEKLNTT